MTDILKRNLAPIPDAAWEQIDETAARVLDPPAAVVLQPAA